MNTVTAIITGSRTIKDYELLDKTIKSSPWFGRIDTVFVGDAKGVDRLAVRWCKENGITYRIFRADWNFYGRGAGPERNNDMIQAGGQVVIALWDGESKGTKNMLYQADVHGLVAHVKTVNAISLEETTHV